MVSVRLRRRSVSQRITLHCLLAGAHIFSLSNDSSKRFAHAIVGKVRALAQSALSPLSRPNSSLLGRNSRLGAKEGRFPMGPRISSFSSTGIGVMTIGQLNDSSADNNNRRRAGTEG